MRAYVRADLSSPADVSSEALSFRAEHDMHLDYARVHFFPTTAGERTRWLAVRRMNIEPLEDAYRVRTSFADGAECPVMADVLLLADQVEKPVIDLPKIPLEGSAIRDRGNGAGPMFAWHGGQFEMSAPSVFASSDTLGEITIRGSDNTPVGAWAKAALAALEPCWRDDLPPDLAEQARVLADQRARSRAEDQRRRREASVGQSDD